MYKKMTPLIVYRMSFCIIIVLLYISCLSLHAFIVVLIKSPLDLDL